MIATLTGVLQYLGVGHIVLDVNGVGYEISMPQPLVERVGQVGDSVKIEIYTHMSDSQIHLYGFLRAHEKMLFKKLLSVSGVGPKLASTMVSSVSFSDLIQAIVTEEVSVLKAISGVGKKTAERVIIELKDKFKDLPVEFSITRKSVSQNAGLDQDVTQALVSLGYSENQARKALQAVDKSADDTVQTLIKKSLGSLNT